MTIEEAEPIEEAESLDYEDEVEKPSKKSRGKEEDKLFGLPIPKKEGMIGLVAVVALVIVLMIASLVVESFGIVPGAKAVKVFMPAGEGIESYEPVGTSRESYRQASNTALNDIRVQVTSPAFGKLQSGDANVKVIYDSETLYSTKTKITNGKGSLSIGYGDIYVDNGEYEVKADFDGKSGSDKVTIERTGKKVLFYQERIGTGNKYTNLSFRFNLLPSEEGKEGDRPIYTWGHGTITIYYVSDDNEDDKDKGETFWEMMEIIDFDISPLSFNYTYQYSGGTFKSNANDNGSSFTVNYNLYVARDRIDRDNSDNENGPGNYTAVIKFYNDFGNEDHEKFDDEAKTAYPEENERRMWSFIDEDEYSEDG